MQNKVLLWEDFLSGYHTVSALKRVVSTQSGVPTSSGVDFGAWGIQF